MLTPAASRYAHRLDSLLLGQYIDTAARLRGADGRYTPAQVRRWLAALAQGLDWQARHHGSATDIQLDQWWQPAGKRAAQIVHTILACVPAFAWLTTAIIAGRPGLALASIGLLGVGALAWPSPSPGRLKFRQLTTRAGLGRLAFGLAVGLAVGLVLNLAFGLAGGIAIGTAIGTAGGIAGGIALGSDDNSPQATGPEEVIRADGRYGIAAGIAFGIAGGTAAGLAVGLVLNLALGIVVGLAFGIVVGIAFGLVWGGTWARYHISVVFIAAQDRGPARFAAFLDWAYQAGLLRVSGTAYQFRHRQLQDWLTSPHQPAGDQAPPPRACQTGPAR